MRLFTDLIYNSIVSRVNYDSRLIKYSDQLDYKPTLSHGDSINSQAAGVKNLKDACLLEWLNF